MERDTHKFATWLAKNARAGVAVEQKILEWKLAEQRLQSRAAGAEQPATKAS